MKKKVAGILLTAFMVMSFTAATAGIRSKLHTPKCEACFIKSFCKKGCPGNAYLYGDFFGDDRFCIPRKMLSLDIFQQIKMNKEQPV